MNYILKRGNKIDDEGVTLMSEKFYCLKNIQYFELNLW